MKRLSIAGVLASVPFMALGGLVAAWWPLNIMFLLLALTGTLYLIEKGGKLNLIASFFVFLIGGSSVEFWWPGLMVGLAIWWYFKQPAMLPLLIAILACASLWLINNNFWALAALPILLLASRLTLIIPRSSLFFYTYYPLHLAALWLIRIPMSNAGYIFF